MGHLDEILDHRLAAGVLAEEHWKDHAVGGARADEFSQADFFAARVRNLDADGRLARHRRNDANVRCPETAGQVARDAVDASHPGTGCKLHRVEGHRRA